MSSKADITSAVKISQLYSKLNHLTGCMTHLTADMVTTVCKDRRGRNYRHRHAIISKLAFQLNADELFCDLNVCYKHSISFT